MRYGVLIAVTFLFLTGSASPQDKQKAKDEKVPFVEPTEVMGKSFKDWLREIRTTRDPSRREEAVKTILMFGPDRAYEAVPEILKEINRHKTTNVDLAFRVNAIGAVGTILQHQKHPDPALLKDALSTYKMCLRDTQAIMRVRAVQGWPSLGPVAHDALDEVITITHDPATWELRKDALQTLTIIAFDAKGTMTPKLLPELRRALDDPSVQVRLTALNALGLIAHANLPKIEETAILSKLNSHLLTETDKAGIIWTHVTIMSAIKEVSKKHVAPITGMLKDADPNVRNQALSALGKIGSKAKPWALPAVEEAVDDPAGGVAMTAVHALVAMQATESIPVLERLASNRKTPQVMREAAEDAVDHLKAKSKSSER